jgi:pre-mRNA-splicing factor ATP-dependent RNA helicase DHX15/PRP43
MTAMTKREFDDDETARVKRVKVESNGDGKMANNPYLAHWNDDKPSSGGGGGGGGGLDGFQRHTTTTKQASRAEDGPNNAFTGRPLSSKYMSILKTRRGLPVHQQRYVDVMTILLTYPPSLANIL